eukprot:gene20061-22030_t
MNICRRIHPISFGLNICQIGFQSLKFRIPSFTNGFARTYKSNNAVYEGSRQIVTKSLSFTRIAAKHKRHPLYAHSLRFASQSNSPSNSKASLLLSSLKKPFSSVKQTTRKNYEVSRLINLSKPEWKKLTAALGLLILSSSVTMLVPFCIGKLIDIIYTSSDDFTEMLRNLRLTCVVLSFIFFAGAAANLGRVYIVQTSGQRIVNRLRQKVFSSIIKQETAFFDKNPTGELINRLSSDTTLVGKAITDNVSDGLRSFAQGVAGVSLMFFVSPKLAGVVLSIVPPVVICTVIYGRYVRSITKKVQDSLAGANQVAEERISNIRTVRAFAQELKESKRYDDKVDSILSLAYKEALARAAFFGFTGFSGNMIVVTVLYSGGHMMSEAQMTVGDLTSFLLYTVYVGISIAGLSSFYSELMKGVGASSRIWQLVDRKPEIPVKGGLIPPNVLKDISITFSNVHFSYPTRRETPVLRGIDFTVPSGSVTAVVGASGSGKSTIGSLLLRLYDPDCGHVGLGGYDVAKLDPSWLRQYIGTVNQEPILFSCSIADNIAYGCADPSELDARKIIEAAEKANAMGFIQSFSDGLQTVVGERGQMLSGGQRQRIAIARAILKDPKVLLLDEATSALDAESEYLVQDALQRLMVGRTTIIIAHRLFTIKAANQVVVVDNGKIAEAGTYDALIKKDDGLFRKLVDKQSNMNDA